MSDGRELFIERKIIGAVKRLLAGRVNKVLREYDFAIPEIEFGNYAGGNVVVPVVTLAICERTEKERLIFLDTYSLTITFSLPETPENELCCYAYTVVVKRAVLENSTLDGIADRAVIVGCKYAPAKKPQCGEGWKLTISFQLTVEEMKI